MPDNEIDLLAIDRGTVTAPAGCGKTQLIADALTRHSGSKPILVLTHTNAGVAALRERLKARGVPAKAYHLSTIDGWAMRLISTFPMRSAYNPERLRLSSSKPDYPSIRGAAATLIGSGHIDDILAASYARLIVDEYQDCTISQHRIVACTANTLPTCVLGDPMQAIFGFDKKADGLANWEADVLVSFPPAGELNTPWRWIKAGAEPLGRWLGDVRVQLKRGRPIDLGTAPDVVKWVGLDGKTDHVIRLKAAKVRPPNGNGRVLVIGHSARPESQQKMAGQTPGAITVEAVEMPDLVKFAGGFDPMESDAFARLVDFAKSVMTGFRPSELRRRVDALMRGTAHRSTPTEVEAAALSFFSVPSHRSAADVLEAIEKQTGVRAFRPVVLGACVKALRLCETTEGLSFRDAVLRIREQYRHLGRSLPKRAVGSTLLLKGLEAEVAVILDADAMDARNLYVALTRGSKALVVCSRHSILKPRSRSR